MVVSFFLSGLIYITANNEISGGLSNFSTRVISNPDKTTQRQIDKLQDEEVANIRKRILTYLNILNISIFIMGGLASFMIASQTISTIEASHKAQVRFTSDASHELRTPLAAMKSELEASLLDKKITKSELRSSLESAVEEVDKMTELTAMLLDLSRVNTLSYDAKPVEVNHAVQSVVDRIGKPNRIKFKHTKPAYIKGNEIALETVFNILIDNALKYSSKNSKVTITVTQNTVKVFVSITNLGDGISSKDIDHIFDHFYRGENKNNKIAGYGMGLTLAKEIVNHHSGHINVKSTTGKTTTFTVVIPKNSKPLSVI